MEAPQLGNANTLRLADAFGELPDDEDCPEPVNNNMMLDVSYISAGQDRSFAEAPI